jgi:hypothetical protein
MAKNSSVSVIFACCGLILAFLTLQGCASINAALNKVDYGNTSLLNSGYMVGETDVLKGKVAFSALVYHNTSYACTSGSSIFIANTDGSGQKMITPARIGVHDTAPSWTRDGNIVFHRSAYNEWGPTSEHGYYLAALSNGEVTSITKIRGD